MNKRSIYLKCAACLLAAFLLPVCSGCSQGRPAEAGRPAGKPVSTVEIKEEEAPVVLEYFGIVASGETKKMSFKFAGKIASLPVKKGDAVRKGTVLASLDTRDLEFAAGVSKSQIEALDSQLSAALSAFRFAADNYEKAGKLLESGAISRNAYDEAKLNYEVRQSSLNTVREQRSQAATDYSQKSGMLEDAVLVSDADGFVADVLYKAGEVAPAGYPVVVVRNVEQVVNAGLTQKGVTQVSEGMKAQIESEGASAEGSVKSVSDVPDPISHTYNAEITVPGGSFPLGATVKVKIIKGQQRGVWIPVSSIMSNENDYVFIAENGRAVKKAITIKSVNGSRALVEGLQSGQQLIAEGSKKLKHMDLVIVQR